MNETAPLQKQDLDRIGHKLEAVIEELRRIRELLERERPPAEPKP